MARGEQVTLVRPTDKVRFGDRAAGTPDRYDVGNTLIAPTGSTELGVGAGANTVDTVMTIYPPHSIVDQVPGGPQATDQFEVRGQLYQVVGDPQDWGTRNRMVIALKKVTG